MLKWADNTRSRKTIHQSTSLDSASLSSGSTENSSSSEDLQASSRCHPHLQQPGRAPMPTWAYADQIVERNGWKASRMGMAASISPRPRMPLPPEAYKSETSCDDCQATSTASSHKDALRISTSSQSEMLKVSTNDSRTKPSFWKNLWSSVGRSTGRSIARFTESQQPPQKNNLKKSRSLVELSCENMCVKSARSGKKRQPLANAPYNRQSLKSIKKGVENKKPKPFTRWQDANENNNIPFDITSKCPADLDSSAPSSIDSSPGLRLRRESIGSLEREFSEAVERILSLTADDDSPCDDESADGDVFCYDSDTVLRKPSNIQRGH